MVFRRLLSAVGLFALWTATACQVIARLDDKTSDACVGRPTTDLAPGASSFAGTCLADTGGAPDVKTRTSSDAPPTAVGGTIEDGTYFLTTATIYTTAMSSGYVPYDGPTREVLHVVGNQLFYVTQYGTDEPISHWGSLSPSGLLFAPDPASFLEGYRCPPVACHDGTPSVAPVADETVGYRRPSYTATPTQLLLIYPDENLDISTHSALLTFEKQH